MWRAGCSTARPSTTQIIQAGEGGLARTRALHVCGRRLSAGGDAVAAGERLFQQQSWSQPQVGCQLDMRDCMNKGHVGHAMSNYSLKHTLAYRAEQILKRPRPVLSRPPPPSLTPLRKRSRSSLS